MLILIAAGSVAALCTVTSATARDVAALSIRLDAMHEDFLASTLGDLALWGHLLFGGAAMAEPYLDRLLGDVPVAPNAPGVLYGAGVAFYAQTPHGPVYDHGGWIPACVSSMRHYADHGVTAAFQINTDAGFLDETSDLVPTLEAALANVALGAVQ